MILLCALTTFTLAIAHQLGAVPGTYVLYPALLTAALIVYTRLIAAWLRVEPGYDELHLVRATDGWTLPLYRYRCDSARGAVLMVHGIYSTMGLFDIGEGASLARHLRGLGYDVYCLELRDMGVHGKRSRWYALHKDGPTFDDYVLADLPAAVAEVQRTSGFSRINYLGHSMGGMVFYPYGGTGAGQKAIARAVTLGSLAGLPDNSWLRFLPIPWPLLIRLPHYGVREAAMYLLAPLVGFAWLVESIFLNPANVNAKTRRRYFFSGVANSPYSLIGQFGAMLKSGHLMSRDGRSDFSALMHANTVPTLVIAASKDNIAPVSLVQKGFAALGGEKRWLELGKKVGSARDFGHTDLIIGHAAEATVWPEIVRWFEGDASRSDKPS